MCNVMLIELFGKCLYIVCSRLKIVLQEVLKFSQVLTVNLP